VWWVGSRPHDVYLGTRGFAVCAGDGKPVWQETGRLQAGLDAFVAWLGQVDAKAKLRLWLSGGLCRPFVMQAVPGVSGEAEWQRVAAAMAPMQTGLAGPCEVWLSKSAQRKTARVAVAVEQQLLQRLQALVEDAGTRHRLISMRPWWSEVLRAALLRDAALPALAVQDCDALTVLAGTGDGFDTATTLTPIADCESAHAALARWLLTADVAADRMLRAQLAPYPAQAPHAAGAFSAFTHWSR
jgi:hypothetical protein